VRWQRFVGVETTPEGHAQGARGEILTPFALARAGAERRVCFARRQSIFFLWRPRLRDPGDDMVLEAAVAAGARSIITFNKRDFESGRPLPVRLATPQEFLRIIGVAT
jgi:hypothetical protein